VTVMPLNKTKLNGDAVIHQLQWSY
jgi:hypothetical protein